MRIFRNDSGDLSVYASPVGFVLELFTNGKPHTTLLSHEDGAKLRRALALGESGDSHEPDAYHAKRL